MPITILKPQPAAQPLHAAADSDTDSDSSGGADIHGDVPMRAPKRRRPSLDDEDGDEILTPGSVITTNPQWMRYVTSRIGKSHSASSY